MTISASGGMVYAADLKSARPGCSSTYADVQVGSTWRNSKPKHVIRCAVVCVACTYVRQERHSVGTRSVRQ